MKAALQAAFVRAAGGGGKKPETWFGVVCVLQIDSSEELGQCIQTWGEENLGKGGFGSLGDVAMSKDSSSCHEE